MLGPVELTAITLLVVLFVGYKRLPSAGHELGKATEYLRRSDDLDLDELEETHE